jgi:hypothetical protein
VCFGKELQIGDVLELLAHVVSHHREAARLENASECLCCPREIGEVVNDVREEDHADRTSAKRKGPSVGEATGDAIVTGKDLGEHLRRVVERYDVRRVGLG